MVDFISEQNGNGIFENFEIPNYNFGISGNVNNPKNTKEGNEKTDNGVIILEDLSAQGYRLVDPDFMMLNLDEMTVIMGLFYLANVLQINDNSSAKI